MEGKEEFFRVYSNLPLEEREKVVIIINEEPVSWNVAYQHIKNGTKLGDTILKFLKELKIL